VNISPRFNIVDDDPDLLRRFTAYIKDVVTYAQKEYERKLEYRTRERPLEHVPPELLSYDSPLPVEKDGFDFAEDRLSEEFSKLKLLRRQILTLTFVEGLSPQEAADKLNCSVETVYLQKHRALKALREQMVEGGDEDGE
jgi:RNA polymerase sigma factor (sigma-70 family)